MLYTHANRGRGCGRARGRFVQGRGTQGTTYEKKSRPQDGNHRGAFERRGSFHSGSSSPNSTECGYCGKIGHHDEGCRKKKRESASISQQLTNYATNFDYEDHGGMFVMRHRENSMSASTSTGTCNLEDVWFVDSGASNHMTSHQEWFRELREPE